MPTQSFIAALLVLGNTEGLPWNLTPWQAITKVYGPLWSTTEDVQDDSPAPFVAEWTVRLAKSVKTFADNVWLCSKAKQDKYIVTEQPDNDTLGHTTWAHWVTTN